MKNQTLGGTPSRALSERPDLCRVVRLFCASLLFLNNCGPCSVIWANCFQQKRV
jgi:hypothetical protein